VTRARADEIDQVVGRLTADEDRGPYLSARIASTITPVAPRWLWRGWILRDAFNILVGRQGCGKTTLAAHVTGMLTRGLALPGDTAAAPISVGFLSLEEPADRVVARLHAGGANLERVQILGDVDDVDDEGNRFRRRWQLPKDVGILGQAIVEHGLALVIVDGLGYSISGDSHNYAVVGSALAALAGEAERSGAAILGLVHPPKGASDPVTAAIGSTAWTAIPRVSIVLGLDPNDETRATRVVSVAKSNYEEPASALAFEIGTDAAFECGAVVVLRPTSVSAEEVMAAPVSHEERTERSGARDFLRDLLRDGPLPSDEVNRLAEQAGISKRTIERARRDVGAISSARRDAHNRVTGWMISLPESTPPSHTANQSQPWRSWRSGRSGSEQGIYDVPLPDRQPTASGGLDGVAPPFNFVESPPGSPRGTS